MIIHLDEKQAEYLLKLLDRQSPYWVKDKIIEEIEQEISTYLDHENCIHSVGLYNGKKTMCKICGKVYEFNWELIGDHEVPTPLLHHQATESLETDGNKLGDDGGEANPSLFQKV